MCFGVACKPSSTSVSNSDCSACREMRFLSADATISRLSDELGQTQPAELPARRRIKEVAVAHTLMAFGRRQRGATEHHLADHELAVVFAESAFGGAIPRIWQVGTARPLPGDAEGIRNDVMACSDIPFRFARQILSCKASEGVSFVIADMLHRCRRIDRPEAAQCHDMPGSVLLPPIARCLPVFVLHRCPAVREPERRRRVTASGNEFEPFRVRDEMSCNPDTRNEFIVGRRFVIKAEAFSVMTGGMYTGGHVN